MYKKIRCKKDTFYLFIYLYTVQQAELMHGNKAQKCLPWGKSTMTEKKHTRGDLWRIGNILLLDQGTHHMAVFNLRKFFLWEMDCK